MNCPNILNSPYNVNAVIFTSWREWSGLCHGHYSWEKHPQYTFDRTLWRRVISCLLPEIKHRILGDSAHRQVTTLSELSHFFCVAYNSYNFCSPSGDLAAIERVAYEFCEDKARNGVLYLEARYSPHFLLAEGGPSDIEGVPFCVFVWLLLWPSSYPPPPPHQLLQMCVCVFVNEVFSNEELFSHFHHFVNFIFNLK